MNPRITVLPGAQERPTGRIRPVRHIQTTTDIIHINSYEQGCQSDGHYLGTTLKPGVYELVKVEE